LDSNLFNYSRSSKIFIKLDARRSIARLNRQSAVSKYAYLLVVIQILPMKKFEYANMHTTFYTDPSSPFKVAVFHSRCGQTDRHAFP